MNYRISSQPCPPRNSIGRQWPQSYMDRNSTGRQSHTGYTRFRLYCFAWEHCPITTMFLVAFDNIVAFPAQFGFCYVTNWPIQEALNSEWVVIAASSKTTGRVSTRGPSSETAQISPFSPIRIKHYTLSFQCFLGLFLFLPSVAFELKTCMIRARSWETFIAIHVIISH